MKTIKLEISLKKYSEISVQVPDDFDEKTITRHRYAEAITTAANETLDGMCWDEPPDEPIEVEQWEILEGDELAKEIRDHGEPIDLSAAIAAAGKAEAEMLEMYRKSKVGATNKPS